MPVLSPLRLHPIRRDTRPAEAWWLPTADPAVWIAEIARWRLPLGAIRLAILPASRADTRPAGAVAITGREVRAHRALPYVLTHGRVLHPRGTELLPVLREEELHQLLSLPRYVFHPPVGLVGYEEADLHPAVTLLSPPRMNEDDWGLAMPGVYRSTRIRSLYAPPLPPDLSLLEQGRDDIGTADPREAPPPEGQTEPGVLGQLGDRAKQALLGGALTGANALEGVAAAARFAVGGLTSRISGGPGEGGADPKGAGANADGDGDGGRGAGGGDGGGWLSGWLRQRMTALNERIEEARDRELFRLRKLLESNPDLGLQYAIPLSTTSEPRGMAAPGSMLQRRDARFNMGRVNDGGPVDGWAIRDAMRRRLRALYLEAAEREVELGRWRRAAYIHGELLGDLRTAAALLRRGRYWREAAALYKDRLHNPRVAAECLEEGGLLREAIQLHVERGAHETAGDLYRKLDEEEAARAQYRLALEAIGPGGDPLEAARLLFDKLDDPAAGVARLDAAWPAHKHAARALREAFGRRRALGWHDDALTRLGAVLETTVRGEAEEVAACLATLAPDYPDERVRAAAADGIMILAGTYLLGATVEDRRGLCRSLGRAMPEDALLRRDAERYRDRLEARPKARATPKAPQPEADVRDGIRIVQRIPYPEQFTALAAAATSQLIVIAGYLANHRNTGRLLFYDHRGRMQHAHCIHLADRSNLSLDAREHGPQARVLWADRGARQGEYLEVDTERLIRDGATGVTMRKGFDCGIGEAVVDGCLDRNGYHLLRRVDDRLQLDPWQSLDLEEDLEAQRLTEAAAGTTDPFGDEDHGGSGAEASIAAGWDMGAEFAGEAPSRLVAHDGALHWSYGSRLFLYANEPPRKTCLRVHGDIRHLVTNRVPRSVVRVAMAYGRGGAVLWPKSGKLLSFDKDRTWSSLTFLGNGNLVVVAEDGAIREYRTSGEALRVARKASKFEVGSIAVACAVHRHQFVIARREGGAALCQ